MVLFSNFEEPYDFPHDSLVPVPTKTTKAEHNIDTAILSVNRHICREARKISLKQDSFQS